MMNFIRRSSYNKKVSRILFFSIVILLSCNDEPKQFEYCTAYVYESTPIHWGRGFFKQRLKLEFYYEKKLTKKVIKINDLSHIHSLYYNDGDSVLIRFPKENLDEFEIVKKIYIKSKNYHIP